MAECSHSMARPPGVLCVTETGTEAPCSGVRDKNREVAKQLAAAPLGKGGDTTAWEYFQMKTEIFFFLFKLYFLL